MSAEKLLEWNRTRWARGESATFSICDNRGDFLGHVFVNLAVEGRATIGYWLLAEARGQGFATRAVRLTAEWALRELPLARLGLFAEPCNEASQRVAKRAGFQREGVLRSWSEIDGRRVDYVSYSLLPSDLSD